MFLLKYTIIWSFSYKMINWRSNSEGVLRREIIRLVEDGVVELGYDLITTKVPSVQRTDRLIGFGVHFKLHKDLHNYFSVISFALLLLIDYDLENIAKFSTFRLNFRLKVSIDIFDGDHITQYNNSKLWVWLFINSQFYFIYIILEQPFKTTFITTFYNNLLKQPFKTTF